MRFLTLAFPVVSTGSGKDMGSTTVGGEEGRTQAAGNGSLALAGGGGGICRPCRRVFISSMRTVSLYQRVRVISLM